VKGGATNVLIVVAVVVLVTGVAWFRSNRQPTPVGTNAPAPVRDSGVVQPASAPATAPVQKGDLCPEPLPTTKAVATSTSTPATPATSQAAARKLPRVVDLGADKCIPCKKLAPILEELKKEYAGRVTVDFIDVWKDPKAGEPYKIRVIPTQIFFAADGKEVWRHEGFLPKEDFVKKFAELGVK